MKTLQILIFLFALSCLTGQSFLPQELYAQTFTGPELLARPTDTSVTVHVVADTALQAYFKYGEMQGGPYTGQTGTVSSPANEPIVAVIGGLQANTRYYYRMVFSTDGGLNWVERAEHTFHTRRAPGSPFTFTIISDSHMNGGGGNEDQYEQTLDNVNDDHPDFHFDLGDTFWIDGANITSTIANQRYLNQRQWMGAVSHSAAVFLAVGNHENEEGWNFDDTPVSKALLSVNARKRYYPNPITDGFYSGNDDTLEAIAGDDKFRENYYAWEWGDALFVVIDPYHYTLENPYAVAGGEDNDEGMGSRDRWDWTLGQQQFNWLRQTLEYSNAKFKFVFAHHMLGGAEDFVRGGAGHAHMFEWGGYDIDGTTWGFDRERPGWGGVPVHQLMDANGVSAFFYGHDHLYAYQKRDGVVYQEVPSAGLTGSGLQAYYQNEYTLELLPSPGHLRITVSPSQAMVDYVQTSGGGVAHSYTILPASYLYGDYAPTDCDVDGSDLAEWIANGAPAGRDITAFAQNFGRTSCP
jgi:hypothetical protein